MASRRSRRSVPTIIISSTDGKAIQSQGRRTGTNKKMKTRVEAGTKFPEELKKFKGLQKQIRPLKVL